MSLALTGWRISRHLHPLSTQQSSDGKATKKTLLAESNELVLKTSPGEN